jgi:parallel beta-helix repeat protein
MRQNFWGRWPDVLNAVFYNHPDRLDIQGFVGVAFDESFDTGPYWGGTIINTDTTWQDTIYITGDVSLEQNAQLTIAQNTNVYFVPTDQNDDQIGDWSLLRNQATLSAVGTESEPILFSVLGDVPAGGGFISIRGDNGGTSTITHVTIESGANCYQELSGQTNMSQTTIQNCMEDGLQIIMDSQPLFVGDGLLIDNNAGWGVMVDWYSDPANTITNSTITNNHLGGIYFHHGSLSLDHNQVKYNGYGIKIVGNSNPALSYNDILFNTKEGLLVASSLGNPPAPIINYNNIYGNATQEAIYLEAIDFSTSSPSNGYGNFYTQPWTTPNGNNILFAQISYTESTSSIYLTGYLQKGPSYSNTHTFNSPTTQWCTLLEEDQLTQSIRGQVYDDTYSPYATITLQNALYNRSTIEIPRSTELSAVLSSGTIDATNNYWGTFPDVADRIFEAVTNSVDYSGFTSSPISSTGPQ